MKLIGAIIGVNESRISQLLNRALRRLRKVYGEDESSPVSTRLRLQKDLQRLKLMLGQIQASDRQVFLAHYGLGVLDISEFGLSSSQVQSVIDRVWKRLEQMELRSPRRNQNRTQG